MHRTYICAVEREKRSIALDNVQKIADAIEVETYKLFIDNNQLYFNRGVYMEPTKLSQHKFKKGKFVTPLNDIPQMKAFSDEQSWTYGRLPEYIWIALILERMGRKDGLASLYHITNKLKLLAPNIKEPKLSSILSLNNEIQIEFFKEIQKQVPDGTLSPLTLIFTVSKYPIFAKSFYTNKLSTDERRSILLNTMRKAMHHQTHESTDVRFIVLWFNATAGRLHMLPEHGKLLSRYPQIEHDNEEMRAIRPFIRSCEATSIERPNNLYLKNFWRCVSKMSDCELTAIKFPTEEHNTSLYNEHLYETLAYLNELYKKTNPIDEKMSVILGIATYSYKRFKEVCEHNLYNTISGRGCIRVMIESYIMMKYLLINEPNHDNIWRDYKIYGTGLYKLVLSRHREVAEKLDSHFDMPYIEALVNEFWIEDFIDMDTKYFDKVAIRIKAEQVGEKDLYGLYYDYDSSFEHGLWGAIRESSLLRCENPAHQYHCVPDIDGAIQLKSVLPDCIMVMNKIIVLLNQLYGIPENIYKEVIDFEL